MNSRIVGIAASMISSAVAAWFLARRYGRARARTTPARERGRVIFDNTPHAAGDQP